MTLQFSIIIPVYNRQEEIDELLQSLREQVYTKPFEVIVIEDGSDRKADEIILKHREFLDLKYHYIDNSGAGASRNIGMQMAKGNYFVIFDSDCIIPPEYLSEVEKALLQNYTDAYGGPDAAHSSFSTIQKAINYSMTSFLTTGGLRGHKRAVDKFQPRSFNFGISKKAFEVTKGFGSMEIGEDIDLTFRLWEHEFETQFVRGAFVYHKRRTNLKQFFNQVHAFGKGRPFLNRKFPGTSKVTYWFPALFLIFLMISTLLVFQQIYEPLIVFMIYFLCVFLDAFIKNKSITVAIMSVVTTFIQFLGYGWGFLKGIFN